MKKIEQQLLEAVFEFDELYEREDVSVLALAAANAKVDYFENLIEQLQYKGMYL